MATPGKPIGSRLVIEKALAVLEEIQKIGFPNTDNFETLHALVLDLAVLGPHLSPADQVSIREIVESMEAIHKRLQKKNEVSIRRYTKLNKFLILLKTSLLSEL